MWSWGEVIDILGIWVIAAVIGGIIGYFYGFVLKPFFKNLKDETNKLFQSIRKFTKEEKLLANTIRVVFIIILFWFASEVGGDFYSFQEIVYSLLIALFAFYVIIKADW